jgi:hypothetical protein
MAGTIIADTIQATSQQISLNVGNTTILTASSTGLTLIPTTNVNINVTNSTVAFGSGNVSRPSISFSGNTSTGLYMPLANTIAWTVAGSEAMRFDSSGNLGIGTNSPSYRLDVVGAGSPANGIVRASSHLNNNSTKYGYYTVGHYTNSVAPFGFIQGESNATENNVHIGSGAGETTAATRIDFYTASNNTTTGGTERMRIDSGGNVLFNCTSLPGGSDAVYAKIIKGTSEDNVMRSHVAVTGSKPHFYFFNPNGLVGNISTSGSATSYNTSSDYRLKNNIAPMTGALEKVALLKPVTYKWKADGSSGQGFIAHELQEVVPDCVTGEKDAVDADGNPVHQGFDASFLIATLTAAIQELKVIVDAQAVEIAALKAK